MSTSGSGSNGANNGILSTVNLSGAAQILLFRKDINLGAAIQAFQDKNLAEILAEPNLLTTDGQEANFVSGGSFPIPSRAVGRSRGRGNDDVRGIRRQAEVSAGHHAA